MENEATNYLPNITRIHSVVSQIGKPGGESTSIKVSEQVIHKKLTYAGSWYFVLDEWDDISRFIIAKIEVKKKKFIESHIYPFEKIVVDEGFKLFDKRKTYKVAWRSFPSPRFIEKDEVAAFSDKLRLQVTS